MHPTLQGKKYNARKENVVGAMYHGVQIYRFLGKCSTCSAPFSLRTDPEHMDYAMEAGATRNFEPWKASEEGAEAAAAARAADEAADAMKALENRTLDSKRQMDILDALEEIRSMRARQAALGPDDVLAMRTAAAAAAGPVAADSSEAVATEEDEDAAAVAAAFAKPSTSTSTTRWPAQATATQADGAAAGAGYKRRIRDEEEEDGGGVVIGAVSSSSSSAAVTGKSARPAFALPIAHRDAGAPVVRRLGTPSGAVGGAPFVRRPVLPLQPVIRRVAAVAPQPAAEASVASTSEPTAVRATAATCAEPTAAGVINAGHGANAKVSAAPHASNDNSAGTLLSTARHSAAIATCGDCGVVATGNIARKVVASMGLVGYDSDE